MLPRADESACKNPYALMDLDRVASSVNRSAAMHAVVPSCGSINPSAPWNTAKTF